MKRQLAAIMFTDMVGFTSIMAENEILAKSMLDRHRDIVDSHHEKHHGDLVQYYGDGTLSLFASAKEAVSCAIAMQLACQAEPKIVLRIGIHIGEVVRGPNGIFGNAVNIASRVESMAVPGSILCSAPVIRELTNHPSLQFSSLGSYSLKNVPDVMELFSVVHDQLPEGTAIDSGEKGNKVVSTAAINTGKNEKSIAVLPFKDLSDQQDQKYFCDGISDEIMTDLSGLEDMIVIAGFSASQLASSELSTPEIASVLGAQFLVTGSVHKVQDALRITAQVINAPKGRQLWAGKVKGHLSEIFDLQEAISSQIVASLNLSQSGGGKSFTHKREIEDPRAYDVYLQARAEMAKRTAESFQRAEELLNKAIGIIGPNPLLVSTQGHVLLSYNLLGISPDPSYVVRAEDKLEQLAGLAPHSRYTNLLRGIIRYKQGRIQEGIDNLKKVVETDPNNKEGLMFLSLLYLISGYAHYAKPLLDRLLSIDPLEPTAHLMPGYVKFIMGDFEGAIPHYKEALDMAPDNPFIALLYCQISSRVVNVDELIPILEQIEPLADFHTFGRQAKFLKRALQGDRQGALEAGADPRLQNEARYDEHPSWWMTCVYSVIDEKEKALKWLQNTIDLGFINYPLMAYQDPAMQNLRSEERFWELMQIARNRWEAIQP